MPRSRTRPVLEVSLTETLRITPTAELDFDALAALFNEAYRDYEVPMHVDAGAIAFMHDALDLAPERSCLAWEDGKPIGVGFLGLRGTRAWIGGMGVTPAARRRGIGERIMKQLIAQAREAGVQTLLLEVLEENARARQLYEKLGFRTFRQLEVLHWDGVPPPAVSAAIVAADPHAARRRILANRRIPEPWQRDDETLDRLDVSTPALRAVSSPAADAIYRVTDGRAAVLQMTAPDVDSAGQLLDAIRAKPEVKLVRFLNVPANHPAAKALHLRGATKIATQLEMALELQRH